jgi:arginyl-tRNA synthetase
MNLNCINDLQAHLSESYDASDLQINADVCPADMAGDVTVNCFRFARDLKSNPMQIAEAAGAYLAEHADVETVEVIKAFVNVTVCAPALIRDTISDEQAMLADTSVSEASRQRILVEYSAPNTNKPQHLGHVRNNTLGLALCGILGRVGHDVVPVNLVNDRGIAICKSMLAYQRFGDGCTPESTGTKGDHLVGSFYVKFDQELRSQLAELRDSDASLADVSDNDLFLKTELGAAAHEMLVAWENGDDDVRALWRMMNDWVLAGFDETYERFGVTFDQTYYESDTYVLGKDIVDDGLARDVFYKRDDGATEIDLSDMKLDKKVVLRSDGTSVYVTQDIGTTLLKHNDFKAERMIWIVGDEQIYHFRVLCAILQRLGYDWADDLHHLAYGMVHLPEGKMKSREGTVVDADDLFDGMIKLAREATLERSDAPPEDLEHRAEVIGLGALKFMLLKVNARSTIKFDPQAAVKFEGDTGPYILFAYARIASILRKQGEYEIADTVDWSLLTEVEEKNLAIACTGYGAALRKAAADLDPSSVAAYLLDLAREFSRFVNKHMILHADTPELRRARLELCKRVQAILKDGLDTLTIGTLEAM